MKDVYQTAAFEMLQQGMKDRDAFAITNALWLAQWDDPSSQVFEKMEQFATDELKAQNEMGHV